MRHVVDPQVEIFFVLAATAPPAHDQQSLSCAHYSIGVVSWCLGSRVRRATGQSDLDTRRCHARE